MKKRINEFIKYYEGLTARKIYYTTSFEEFDYKHYFIFTKSNEVAYAFETDRELEEFIYLNLNEELIESF